MEAVSTFPQKDLFSWLKVQPFNARKIKFANFKKSLTLFRMGWGGGVFSFSPVTSTNVGIGS